MSHFYIKTNILPRQARDKHTENSKRVAFFAGLQWRRRRPRGTGWFDAEAVADAQGTKVSGLVQMVSAGRCSAMAEDGREHAALQYDRSYEWGSWTFLLLPPATENEGGGHDDGGGGAESGDGLNGSLVIYNRRLVRSSYRVVCAATGQAVLTSAHGGTHDLS